MRWRDAIRISKLKSGKPRMATIGLKTLMIVEYEGDSAEDYPGDNTQYSIAGYHYDTRGGKN